VPHCVRAIAVVLVTLLGTPACATDDDEDLGPTVISKVVVMEIPVSKAPVQNLSIASPCFAVPLVTPHDCSVSVTDRTTDGESVVPTCAQSPTARPCYGIVPDLQNCFEAEYLKLDVNLEGLASYEMLIRVQCVSQ
jgi:hypothetical protein